MGSGNSVPLQSLTIQHLTLDDLAKIVTIIALILGGIGAYYKLIKGRVYTIRLEPRVACQVFRTQNGCDLLLTSHLRNVGFSRVEIQQTGSGLRLLSGERYAAATTIHKIKWKTVAAFPVFEDHKYLGANETIEDQQLIAVPQCINQQDFRVELWVTSQGSVWKAFHVVTNNKNNLG